MRYYVNIPLPSPFTEKVGAFKKKWQGNSRSAPHITLVVPREVPNTTLAEELIQQIDAALSTIESFPITTTGLGPFNSRYPRAEPVALA